MYLITHSGLQVIGSRFEAPRLGLLTYEHDVGTAWLWLAAHRGTFGPLQEVIGERRLRSHDAVRDPSAEPLGVRLGGFGPRGQERLHYPDLLLHTVDGRRIALELELSSKGPDRLETILGGYAADPRVDGVVYLVERASVARSVEAMARRLGMSSLVHIQRVGLTERSPGTARGATPARTVPHGPRRRPGPARSPDVPARPDAAPEASL